MRKKLLSKTYLRDVSEYIIEFSFIRYSINAALLYAKFSILMASGVVIKRNICCVSKFSGLITSSIKTFSLNSHPFTKFNDSI